ncbi:MAG: hypothetical protein LBI34_03760 [Puniceicoccales bacterium]|jgi:hypothetical protein|nr:hypothetical protein [Puniceicoccales bacterium]
MNDHNSRAHIFDTAPCINGGKSSNHRPQQNPSGNPSQQEKIDTYFRAHAIERTDPKSAHTEINHLDKTSGTQNTRRPQQSKKS